MAIARAVNRANFGIVRHYFNEETGLLTDRRVTESVSPSPFNYKSNCLLYLPLHPAEQADRIYFDELAAEIAALVDASWGHALVLFTSYAAMSAVKERLTDMALPQTLFTLGRDAVHTTQQFKASPGSVLLATGVPGYRGPRKADLWLCGERRSKGANAVFAVLRKAETELSGLCDDEGGLRLPRRLRFPAGDPPPAIV